jgi:hypothetical protein
MDGGDRVENLKLEAEWLRLSLVHGLRDGNAVVRWAEDRLLNSERPPACLVEIAGASGAGIQDLMNLLAAVPGRVDPSAARGRVFAELAAQLRARPDTLADVVWRLGRMALHGDVPSEAAPMRSTISMPSVRTWTTTSAWRIRCGRARSCFSISMQPVGFDRDDIPTLNPQGTQ